MAVYLSKEKVEEIFAEYGGNGKNTGSTEGQVALFTYRIKSLSDHLKANKKDHSCRRTLLTLVGKRKRMLRYLAKKDITGYRELVKKLGIRG
ncbi:MAG: 30S ribosomal protein S15 [Saprospiraceae bacterium]|jgi:small subunit ribosomal protein S15|nr:30S ribosomal protein S15 [Saprospiraceae bacterium]